MMRMKKRKTAVFACVIVLFFCAILLGLCWGSYEISVHEVIATLLGNGTKIQNTAIFGIRLLRILLGIFVAAGLAISGGVLQTMTRNELADPGIIGINAGGATAAVLFIQFQTNAYFSELGTFSIYLLPLMAISGALAAAFCIYFLSSRKGLKPKRLLLTGIGINAGLNAFITFFMFKGGPGDYNRVMIWTSGSLWGAGWAYVRALVPVILLGGAYIFYKGRMLDALSFSDETAIGWGISIERERKKMLLCAVILAGASTAFAGNIGFIGLLAPHAAKKVVGNGHRVSLLLASLIAAVMLIFADTVAGNLFSPIEIPAGIAVSLVGVPYFVYLMWKE